MSRRHEWLKPLARFGRRSGGEASVQDAVAILTNCKKRREISANFGVWKGEISEHFAYT